MDKYAQALEAHKKKDIQTAFNLLTQCVQEQPNNPTYRLNLGLVCYEMASASDPIREMAFFNVQEAAKLAPDHRTAWVAFAEVALNCNKFNEAIAAYEKAVAMDGNDANAWAVLGFAYARIGKEARARDCYQRAVEIDPEFGKAHFLLSMMYTAGDYNPEEMAYHAEKAFTAKKPTNMEVEAMWNAALSNLAIGDYDKGWGYFEARLKHHTMNKGEMLPQERYPNRELWCRQRDCRVLVQHEMGLGDCFLFMRMIPILKERYNLEVTFECMPQLLNLVAYNLPGIKVVSFGSVKEEDFDYQLPMMSLPLALEITEPVWNGAYIKAEQHKVDEWREKLGLAAGVKNLGICWAGGQRNYNAGNYDEDKKRSLSYEQIKPLLDGGVNWVSLQVGSKEFPAHKDIKDFSDTAAIIELLDGVVSVDTSVANLAGGMGKKTWLMNRYDTCWRWSRYLKTPWFPSVIDVRQPTHGDWDNVIERIKDAITQWNK